MRIEQTSKQIGESQWKWSVWLEGSQAELDAVKHVTYHLHPTFEKPVVKRSKRKTKFRLNRSGWGTFVIKIEVRKKDGSTDWMRHRLRFSQTEPRVFVSAAASEESEIDAVKGVMQNLDIGVSSAKDVPAGEDLSSTIRENIDQSQALIVINGPTPSRWVLQEVETAKALGKPIISIGSNTFYDTGEATQIASMAELEGAMSKLPE